MCKNGASHFARPVDPVALCIPDYPDKVKHPMDLGTIRENLRQEKYPTMFEFVKVSVHLI
jgi:bromodomain-containing factor 1